MLYLEDFLEVIENLPMEMRERFTDMREADLEVQNSNDALEERTKHFLKKCAQSSAKKEWKDEQFHKIKEDYKKVIEQSDEKVQIANQIYEMVDRHLRRLDVELSKFKMELEADHAGITEMLEKRSLELDNVPKENNPPREKRKYTHQSVTVEAKKQALRVPASVKHETLPYVSTQENIEYTESGSPGSLSNHSSSLGYNLGNVGAQSNAAIRAAATQAIAATHQQQQQGRRSTSLKASVEATKKTDHWSSLSESLSSSSQSTVADTSHNSRSQRVKKHTQKAEELIKAQQAKKHAHQPSSHSQLSAQQSPVAAEVADDGQQTGDWAYDPNEPRYCVCNQVSYGEMVGCDNTDCTIEWFHYGCVGLTSAPKGKWYCPSCTAAMKRRGRR